MAKNQKNYRLTRLSPEQKEVAKTILSVLAMGTLLVVTAVAPNAIQILKLFTEDNRQERFKKYNYQLSNRVIDKLEKRGWVSLSQKGSKTIVSITKKGKTQHLKFNLDRMKIKKPKKWDGFWRIVIFDIPEDHKQARNVLRSFLKRLGFYQLQKSVFVHPYDCEKEIRFIQEVYEIPFWVRFIVAQSIDNEDELKNHFNLS